MRLWSLHPKFLDAQGLVALWREGLLARAVLFGKTRGYTNHPQLVRFRATSDPRKAINMYLSAVLDEATRRGYNFDRRKIRYYISSKSITVTRGQLSYEWRHLQKKLRQRSPRVARQNRSAITRTHPCFRVIPGPVASWEKVT